jgi:hypothetical protein
MDKGVYIPALYPKPDTVAKKDTQATTEAKTET